MKLLNKFEEKVKSCKFNASYGKFYLLAYLIFIILGVIVFSFCSFNFTRDFVPSYSVTYKVATTESKETKDDYQGKVAAILKEAGIKDYEMQISENPADTIYIYNYIAQNKKSSDEMVALGKTIEKNIEDTLSLSDSAVTSSGVIHAKYGWDVLGNISLAFGIAILVVLIYVFIRFDVASAFNVFFDLIFDLMLLFAIYAVFRIPFGITVYMTSGFVILFSIARSVIFYGRIRETVKDSENLTNNEMVEQVMKATAVSNIYTNIILTLVLIAIMAIPGSLNVLFSMIVVLAWVVLSFALSYGYPYIWTKMYHRDNDRRLRRLKAKAEKPEIKDNPIV